MSDVAVLAFDDLDPTTAYAVWRLRQQVFVVEQRSPFPDLDGRDLDPTTRHLLVREGGEPVAYLRLLDDGSAADDDAVPAPHGLVEPLSERELVVLRLLGTDLSGPAIARELVVSLHTVRTHTNHIYAKLGVNDRRAAVRRATDLGLFARPDRRPRRAVVSDR